MLFKNKVVVVTGSTRGIGKAIALAFAREGAIVGVNGTKASLCHEFAGKLVEAGGAGVAIPGDVSDSATAKHIFDVLLRRHGKIDILVNNAGILYVEDCVNTSEEQWDRTMAVNCRGVFLCSQEAARFMIKRKSGKIINIASQLGKTGVAKYTHYCASKFAVIGFTQALAKELAPYGINVNAVCPGVVDTDMMSEEVNVLKKITGKTEDELKRDFLQMIPLGRYETPEDVANLVLFLASEKASYMTGQSINITGGIEVH